MRRIPTTGRRHLSHAGRTARPLEVQAWWDAKVTKAKAEDFVDLRFVDQLKSSGFIEKLYGRK